MQLPQGSKHPRAGYKQLQQDPDYQQKQQQVALMLLAGPTGLSEIQLGVPSTSRGIMVQLAATQCIRGGTTTRRR